MTSQVPAEYRPNGAPVPMVSMWEPSHYLNYLPGVYRQDEFMGRFLLIFEEILGPIEEMVNSLPLYMDPALCPPQLVPYLAQWVDLVLNERHSLERQRDLVRVAAELYRWRGTRRGLRAFLGAITGVTPLIVENTDGLRLGRECSLGLNSKLGKRIPNCITVTVPVDVGVQLDRAEIEALLEAEKPAHAVCLLYIVPRQLRLSLGGATNGAGIPEPAAAKESQPV